MCSLAAAAAAAFAVSVCGGLCAILLFLCFRFIFIFFSSNVFVDDYFVFLLFVVGRKEGSISIRKIKIAAEAMNAKAEASA